MFIKCSSVLRISPYIAVFSFSSYVKLSSISPYNGMRFSDFYRNN